MADIRVGKVSSVNVSARTARVIFGDRGDMVSGELAVLRNSPVTRWTLIFTAGCLISVRWSSALFRTAARGAAISSGVFKWLLEVLEMLFSKSAMTGS